MIKLSTYILACLYERDLKADHFYSYGKRSELFGFVNQILRLHLFQVLDWFLTVLFGLFEMRLAFRQN